MLIEGFRFGMLLQLAIGPMALLTFNTASSDGLMPGIFVTAGVAAADALYIFLASTGLSVFLRKDKTRKALLLFGGVVLILFGLNTLLGAFGKSMMPDFALVRGTIPGGHFLKAFLLAASNPLTIVFWGGVFSAKMASSARSARNMALFGAGCVLSTLLSLGFVAVSAAFVGSFLPDWAIKLMNVIVGIALIVMGLRLPFQKTAGAKDDGRV